MNIIPLLLSAIGNVADKFPNYTEKRARKYHKAVKRYIDETSKPYEQRDDDLVDDLRDELFSIVTVLGQGSRKENT